MIEILFKIVSLCLNGVCQIFVFCEMIKGLELLDKVIDIDQCFIGCMFCSNLVIYIGVYIYICDWYVGLLEFKVCGYKFGWFSFNVKGGCCEVCQGDGVIKIEMYFLFDVYVICEICKGKCYNCEMLEVQFKGKFIVDVLDMIVEDVQEFFKVVFLICDKMDVLFEVGLGYIKVGQQVMMFLGGEVQWVKLFKELLCWVIGKMLYILDEFIIGLYFEDVCKLLEVLYFLVDQGNMVVVIEYNLDVIKIVDWIIDIGLEGGDGGGWIVVIGMFEDVVKVKDSYIGCYLVLMLSVVCKWVVE